MDGENLITTKPIVWLIDEDSHQLRTYRDRLRRMLGDAVEVQGILAYEHIGDYLPHVDNPLTASVIIDQKLKETGVATYTGIQLSQAIRAVNSKLPIYILTNYADEHDIFRPGEWSVEDIIPKGELNDPARREIIAARILRRINVYQDIFSEREERFRQLLQKSFEAELSEEEQAELETLDFERNAATLAAEQGRVKQLREGVQQLQDLVNTLQKLKPSEDDDAE
jgi:DNA-binding NarL/FixJ family response regulator